ncbi:MAG: hypothetical protein WCO18_01540 [bacterium]
MKSELATQIEKYQPQNWLVFFSPLEKNDVLSFFSYEDPEVRESIREIKYGRNRKILSSLTKFSAEHLASYIEENIWSFPSDERKEKKIIFIPIPSHKNRLNEKGFNQADDIAKELSKNFPFGSEVQKNILKKTKDTLHQTDLQRKERLNNLKNAFESKIPKEFLRSFFILIDDVSTTGSTFSEARKTLKRNGADHVICFSLARSGD